nr:unnamed protein product [Callosobruchus analis]
MSQLIGSKEEEGQTQPLPSSETEPSVTSKSKKTRKKVKKQSIASSRSKTDLSSPTQEAVEEIIKQDAVNTQPIKKRGKSKGVKKAQKVNTEVNQESSIVDDVGFSFFPVRERNRKSKQQVATHSSPSSEKETVETLNSVVEQVLRKSKIDVGKPSIIDYYQKPSARKQAVLLVKPVPEVRRKFSASLEKVQLYAVGHQVQEGNGEKLKESKKVTPDISYANVTSNTIPCGTTASKDLETNIEVGDKNVVEKEGEQSVLEGVKNDVHTLKHIQNSSKSIENKVTDRSESLENYQQIDVKEPTEKNKFQCLNDISESIHSNKLSSDTDRNCFLESVTTTESSETITSVGERSPLETDFKQIQGEDSLLKQRNFSNADVKNFSLDQQPYKLDVQKVDVETLAYTVSDTPEAEHLNKSRSQTSELREHRVTREEILPQPKIALNNTESEEGDEDAHHEEYTELTSALVQDTAATRISSNHKRSGVNGMLNKKLLF